MTRTFQIESVLLAFIAVALVGCNNGRDFGPVADAGAAKAIREAFLAGTAKQGGAEAGPVGTGWATIRGQFVFAGDKIPAMPPYNVNKEPHICTVDGKAPPQETLVVDPSSKGIKNVVVFLRDASRVHDSAKAKSEPFVFDQKHCVFSTHVASVTVGQTLDIKNSDPTGHNTNIIGYGFNQLIPEGAAIPFPIQKELAVPAQVTCSIHPWMTAYLLPRKNAYHTVTDAEGRFEIANVPAGEPLEFQVWHESGAAAGKGLVGTTPDAADIKWSNRGRVSMTLKPDEVKEIKIVVPPNAFSI